MFETVETCTEFVSPLWAVLFGAGDACVQVSMWSILLLLLPFAAGVMLLQALVNRAIHGSGGKRGKRDGETFRPKAGQVMARHLRDPRDDTRAT